MKPLFVLCLFLLTGASQLAGASQEVVNPKVKWRFKTEGPIRTAAVISGNNVYLGSADGNVYCLNKEEGTLIWKYQTGGALTGSPTIAANSVFIGGRDNFVYHLNSASGKLIWKFKMQADVADYDAGWDYFSPAAVVHEDRVLIGSGDGNMYALNISNGEILWQFKTGGRIRATALVDKDVIYQPSNDGFVYALDVDSGKLLWKFETMGAKYKPEDYAFDRSSIFAKPLVRENILVLASRDGNTYGVDLNTHKKIWDFSYGTTWAMSAVISEDKVFVGWSTNNLFSALDVHSGEEKWQFKGGAHFYGTALILDNGIYIGSADGNVYNLDKNTGRKLWEYSIGSEIHASLVHDDNTLYFGCDNGYFYALEDRETALLAVYHPSRIEGNAKYLLVDEKISPYFKEKGFEVLEEESRLKDFIEARISDQKPSVIVFAFPVIPEDIIGAAPENGMMREYLTSGGKVVWMGDVPNYYQQVAEGVFKRDASAGSRLLGVEYLNPSESGNYFCKTTQQGLNWGMPAWLKTTGSIVSQKGIIPLGYDEFGRVNTWMKKFNARPGSGFISCRTWSWNVPIRKEDLELIYALAIHELE